MHIIFVTDIFGVSHRFKEKIANICEHWKKQNISCTVIDPYQGVTQCFVDEPQAYQAYLSQCGHQQYLALLAQEVANINDNDIMLIGFSAGASIAWQLAADGDKQTFHSSIKQVIGFYPSQIRYHVSLQAQCPVTLVFPQYETHFDVENTMSLLAQQIMVNIIHSSYLHGFMNEQSVNFQQSISAQVFKLLQESGLLLDIEDIRAKLSDLLA